MARNWGVRLRLGTALLSTLALGVAVLLWQLEPGPDAFRGPAWVWWVAYATFIAVLLLDATPVSPWLTARVWLALLCGCAAAVYLLAPGWTFTAVCLVISATSAAFVLRPAAVYLLVVVQSAVVAAGQLGASGADLLSTTITFGGFQLFSALMAVTALRESRMRDELADANEELRAAQRLLRSTAQAGERLRISRELHDLVGHQLTALALELEVAAHHAESDRPGEAAPHVDRARRTAKDLLGDVRRAVGRLRATPGDVSAAFGSVTGIAKPDVHLDIEDDLDFADPRRANALVRCVQEIVTNAVRHARADHLWITVAREGDHVTVRASDDGRGAANVRPGNGLTGMRERLEGLGGTLAYEGGAGGFTVTARLPAT